MTINAEYKFKPGLKTAIQNGSSLNTVPKFNTQKSDATVSSVFTSNTKSTSSSTRDAALQALSTTQKPSNIFSSNEYAKYGNFVGGMRNVNPSDYKMYNVGLNIDASLASGFAPTSRSQRREDYRNFLAFQRYAQFANQKNDRNDFYAKMSIINQAISMVPKLVTAGIEISKMSKGKGKTPEVEANPTQNSSQATAKDKITASPIQGNNQTVETRPQNTSKFDSAISELSSADYSKEMQGGLGDLQTQQGEITSNITNIKGSIAEETETKTKAEESLAQTEEKISSENQNIQKYSSNITKLESSIQMDENQLQMYKEQLAAANSSSSTDKNSLNYQTLQNQIQQLEAKIEQSKSELEQAKQAKQESEENLKGLEANKKEYQTTIETAEKNISKSNEELTKLEAEQKEAQSAIDKYTQKLTKLEEKESNKLASMKSKLADYAKEYQNETDDSKKAKLQEKYSQQAEEYNNLIKNTSVEGHTEVSTTLS